MTDSGSPRGEETDEAAAEDAKGARLTRLKINRFRQVAPGTELRFDDGINVLLGRNGTGKTTLLELIVAVANGDLRAYQDEEFELEFDMWLVDLHLTIRARNVLERDLPSAAHFQKPGRKAHRWEYAVSLSDSEGPLGSAEVDRREARIHISPDTTLTVEEVPLFIPGFYVLQWGRIEDMHPGDRIFRAVYRGFDWHQRMASCCLRMDEGLDVFRCMTHHQPLPGIGAPLALYRSSQSPPSRESLSSLITDKVESTYIPSSLFFEMADRSDPTPEDAVVTFRAGQLDFIRSAAETIGVKEIQLVLTRLHHEPAREGRIARWIYGKPAFQITTHQGTTYTHDELSYGEKRLLAFLYHAAANPQILVADELVNGLHHEWIQTCLDAIQGQAFLTSQNPLLLDHLPFSSAEEVERRFVLCDRDDQGNWLWRNMTAEEAASFYRAYEVGIQHVSEILETKGLW